VSSYIKSAAHKTPPSAVEQHSARFDLCQLTALISSTSVNHHLYAYGTHSSLFTDPTSTQALVTYRMLYNKTWMTEYLLTVNFCQTKFLLIELKKQLPKYITPPPACNVNVIPENILPLQTKFHFSHILLL